MKNYSIIKADIDHDKENILSILQRNVDIASSQRYDWNYKQCPYGNALCWLAKFESTDSFVGSTSLFPRKLLINKKPTFAAIAGDFAIDKNHRGYGPAFKLHREILSKFNDFGYNFIYGLPNVSSRTFFLRIGYKEIGKYKRYIKLLKTVIVPKEYLPKYLRSNILLKIFDFFNNIVSKDKRVKNKFGYSIEMPNIFDERFDMLWEKASKQFNIIGERSSRFLNWRYKQSSTYDYKLFCILDDKKELAGYLVYYVKDKICHVVDMLFLPSNNLINLLLANFILHIRAKEIGAIVIRYMGNNVIENKLKEFNFFLTKNDDAIVVLYAANLPFESYLLNETNWYFFTGDSDI